MAAFFGLHFRENAFYVISFAVCFFQIFLVEMPFGRFKIDHNAIRVDVYSCFFHILSYYFSQPAMDT